MVASPFWVVCEVGQSFLGKKKQEEKTRKRSKKKMKVQGKIHLGFTKMTLSI